MFEDLLRSWDGEFVASRFDAASDAWMFIGVHSTTLGPGFGGTRMKSYPTVEDGLRDVLRLSAAMSAKNALASLPFGGGKAVLAVPKLPEGSERLDLLRRYADLVDSLGGSYVTACDMNTTERDMDVVGERSSFVMGRSLAAGGSGSSGPDTAVGVYHGIRASLAHVFGSHDPAGLSVAVQGCGAVGSHLVKLLAEAGAKLVVSDVDAARTRSLADRFGARVVPPGDEFDSECDLFSPCATGGVLSAETIPRLRCRIVAGAANNQLATPEDGRLLAEAGILYAPDYIVNAGGVMHLAGVERLGWSRAELDERLAGIGRTLAEVFSIADGDGLTPAEAADRLALARIAAGRA